MAETFRKVAVLGAGVMGSGIAAHVANAGIPVLLLDIVPPNIAEADKNKKAARNAFASGSLEKALKQKPAPFFHARNAELIEVGNLEDDLARIAECDWVVEVVKEDLGVKKALFEKIDKVRKPGTLVTSNTSGIPLAKLIEGRSDDFRKNFFITHFFNPVRYMKLLELVTGPETDQHAVTKFHTFGEEKLGKGIVYGKDTPNFVANRIGIFAMMFSIHEMMRQGLTIEEVDAIVGTPLGRPRSAAFRTADIVGLDTFVHVAQNCYDLLPNDTQRDTFKIPEFLQKLIASGKLGDKTKGGFYEKTKDGLTALDWKSGTWKPQEKIRIDSLGAAKNTEDLSARMKLVVNADDKAGKFAWPVMAQTLIYSAERLGEIADDVRAIDQGMQWGFNWEMGPFQSWDAIGVAESVERMKKDGLKVPGWVSEMLGRGIKSFYKTEGGKAFFYDQKKQAYAEIAQKPRELKYATLKADKKKIVKENDGASLVDLGDGVLGLEFHTKMNALDADIIGLMNDGLDEAEKNWKALVVANDGDNFSAGANLMLIFLEAQQKNWDGIRNMVKGLQASAMRMRQSNIPVVAAPFQMALGGGGEVAMAADAIRAHGELYMGLVEVGVGLIPAGSGTKELLFRTVERIPEGLDVDLLPYVGKAFEAIAMAKVSMSAEEARSIGFLNQRDGISMHRDHLLHDAKQTALGLANAGYRRPSPRKVKVLGRPGYAALKTMVNNLVDTGRASEHDGKIAGHVANILTGGSAAPGSFVTEQHILDLECEAFLSLVGEEKSIARIQAMLSTGKPLRN
jgi:3-hydroxyacyl-CoA dehydrogenase